jgi:hypothetical protein
MDKSIDERLKSLISSKLRSAQERGSVELARILERSMALVRFDGEPSLPPGYRHVRSAIGALMTVEHENR